MKLVFYSMITLWVVAYLFFLIAIYTYIAYTLRRKDMLILEKVASAALVVFGLVVVTLFTVNFVS